MFINCFPPFFRFSPFRSDASNGIFEGKQRQMSLVELQEIRRKSHTKCSETHTHENGDSRDVKSLTPEFRRSLLGSREDGWDAAKDTSE